MRKYNEWNLLIDMGIAMCLGLAAVVGLCMLFYVGAILFPVFIVIVFGWLILQGVRFYNKRHRGGYHRKRK